MAQLVITEALIFGLSEESIMTDWQIATDEEFTDLLVNIIKDPINVFSLTTPIRNHDDTIYTSDDVLYARCRFFMDGDYKGWYNLPICSPGYLNSLNVSERSLLRNKLTELKLY